MVDCGARMVVVHHSTKLVALPLWSGRERTWVFSSESLVPKPRPVPIHQASS